MTLFEFLNAQDGNKLFFYGIFALIALYYICQLFSNIFKYIFKYAFNRNIKDKKTTDKKILEKEEL
jgi:hypothetical protein